MKIGFVFLIVMCVLPLSEQLINFDRFPILFMDSIAATENWMVGTTKRGNGGAGIGKTS